jgi:hypothetical protein
LARLTLSMKGLIPSQLLTSLIMSCMLSHGESLCLMPVTLQGQQPVTAHMQSVKRPATC